jgi:SagB-type dehydrogenase family enzyme
MADNHDVRAARAFLDATIHTPASVRTSGHTLEWDIKPFPFKLYTNLPAISLPRQIEPTEVDTLRALDPGARIPSGPLSVDRLVTLLYLGAGVTRKKTYPGGGEVLFRAAPSTGALYQTEVYVAAGNVADVLPGLYHFCPGDFTLRRLRDGDVRPALAAAAAEPDLARRAATIVLTGLFWRNTWKYQARGWRHLYWDSGTMLANITAAAHALGLTPRVLTGFVDADVNRLLGLDAQHEAALELVEVGPLGTAAPASVTVDEIRHEVVPLSSAEVDYPALREMQSASALAAPADVVAWRKAVIPGRRRSPSTSMTLPAALTDAGRGLGDTIQHRGSSRRFTHAPLTAVELATTLWWSTRPVAADVPSGLVDVFLIVNAVDGLAGGAYRYWPDEHALELLRAGEFRRESAYLCLEQPLGGDAAAVLYFLAPLDALLAGYGNRGYRLANLEAGLIGGRAYLTAYAQRFGATGLTFYDRDVVKFFAPASAGLDAIFVTALGRAARPSW